MQAAATAVDARCGLFNLAYELECGAGVLATHVRVLDSQLPRAQAAKLAARPVAITGRP